MLKKVLKKIEKLNADKIKFIDEQSKIQSLQYLQNARKCAIINIMEIAMLKPL